MKIFLSGTGLLLTSVVLTLGAPQSVTNTKDSGAGSLRAAIADAAPGDTISFALPAPSTITLTTNELLIDKELTITGPGADQLTVARSSAGDTPAFSIFHVSSGNFAVTITSLTVTNGNSSGLTDSGQGGGLYNEGSGTVTVSECTFDGNQAYYNGGGVCHNGSGALNLSDCVITGNTNTIGYGGGLAAENSSGLVTLLHCTVSSNTSRG